MKKEMSRFWNLTFYLAKSAFRIRNEGSFLGILWYLLNPILFFGLLYFIFSKNVGAGVEYYSLYLLMGLITFNLFSGVTSESLGAIRGNSGLLKSLNLPRISFMSGIALRAIFSNLFEFIVIIVLAFIIGAATPWLLFYPVILAFFIIFIFGVSLIIGSISVYFLDFGNIWGFFCNLLWFATPIFYTLKDHPVLSKFSYANPVYYYMTTARDIIIYHHFPSKIIMAGVIGFSIIFLILGLLVFNKLKGKFTEVM